MPTYRESTITCEFIPRFSFVDAVDEKGVRLQSLSVVRGCCPACHNAEGQQYINLHI